MITLGQIYVSCNPRQLGPDGLPRHVRVASYLPGESRAGVQTVVRDGDDWRVTRTRRILVRELHESAVTYRGRRRIDGYAMVEDQCTSCRHYPGKAWFQGRGNGDFFMAACEPCDGTGRITVDGAL